MVFIKIEKVMKKEEENRLTWKWRVEFWTPRDLRKESSFSSFRVEVFRCLLRSRAPLSAKAPETSLPPSSTVSPDSSAPAAIAQAGSKINTSSTDDALGFVKSRPVTSLTDSLADPSPSHQPITPQEPITPQNPSHSHQPINPQEPITLQDPSPSQHFSALLDQLPPGPLSPPDPAQHNSLTQQSAHLAQPLPTVTKNPCSRLH